MLVRCGRARGTGKREKRVEERRERREEITMSIRSVYFFTNFCSRTGSCAPMGLVRSLMFSALTTSYSSRSLMMKGNTGYLFLSMIKINKYERAKLDSLHTYV